jgi:hypothetical protein
VQTFVAPVTVTLTDVHPVAVALMFKLPSMVSVGVLDPVTVLLALVVIFPVCVHVPL